MEASKHFSEELSECGKNSPVADWKTCGEMAQKEYLITVEQWNFKNFYLADAWLILMVICIPPLILYGVLRGIGATSVWISRGFAVEEKAK
jgi:hypothetical protein